MRCWFLIADRIRSTLSRRFGFRFGGDEFAVLVLWILPTEEAKTLGARLIVLRRTYIIEGHLINISVSIGIAGPAGIGPEEIIRCADLALYRAKEAGATPSAFSSRRWIGEFQAQRSLKLTCVAPSR